MSRFSLISSYKKWTRRPTWLRIVQAALAMFAALALIFLILAAFIGLFVAPNLPALDALTDYRPKIPLRVFTADNVLIGEFGEERRDFVPIAQIPASLKKAVIATEDASFYSHGGVDFIGIVRAAVANLWRSRSQGASTITMQVARTFFLTKQKTYTRKIQEIVLAYRIESRLTKDQILELYMNQIYLGERAFGFGSAARTYFGKSVKELTIAESAMLAGLPKAPSSANPIVNPKRASERQRHVLKRMRDVRFITPEQYAQAVREKIAVLGFRKRFGAHAEYVAETVRQYMYAQYKDDIYKSGMSVYTTITKTDQDAAYEAVRRGVIDYDHRHGYRGPEAFVDLPRDEGARADAVDEVLLAHPDSGSFEAAVVLAASQKLVRAELRSGDVVEIKGDGLRFAATSLSPKALLDTRMRPGSVIRVEQDSKQKWSITQLPEVAAALVAVNPQDGAIRALVGGFDFALNQFDHVAHAWRQPGSSIKPFVYSSALEKGFSPSTMIDDSPLSIDTPGTSGKTWNPGNDDGNYEGAVSMRTGLKKSKNVVSIRILRSVTPAYSRDYLTRFGFDADKHPANLTMTLGTGSVTPLQMAGAYAVFANGGYKIVPYMIQKIVDAKGVVLTDVKAVTAGDESIRVLDPRNAYIMDSMMRDVAHSGTAAVAGQKLGRADLAGKTGTTNDSQDGWFAGYGADVVAVAWMGYDQPKSLGSREFGSTLALPMWIDYMRFALSGKPDARKAVPVGLTQDNGDWKYQEYVGNEPVLAPEPEDSRGFFERLFGTRSEPFDAAHTAPAPSAAPGQAAPNSTRPGGGGLHVP